MEERTKRVVIAEDETAIRMNLAAHFSARGWEAIEGRNGIEAVALAVRAVPDLVVLDVMMPGLDGFAAFQELHSDHRTAHIPVMMLSAINDFDLGANHSPESMASALGTDPPAAFIDKPLDATAFFRRVDAILN